MIQRSFASAEYAIRKKRTRREKFLAEMEERIASNDKPFWTMTVRVPAGAEVLFT